MHHERTEERRKLLANKQGGGGGKDTGNVSDRWKKLLGSAMSSARESTDYRRISTAAAYTADYFISHWPQLIKTDIFIFKAKLQWEWVKVGSPTTMREP